jgi:hypothetical protein
VVECGEEHSSKVEEGLGVEPVVEGEQDGRQEEQVTQRQQQRVTSTVQQLVKQRGSILHRHQSQIYNYRTEVLQSCIIFKKIRLRTRFLLYTVINKAKKLIF